MMKNCKSLLECTRNTRAILPDSLRFIRSDAPISPTARDIRFLRENRITTIVDLRSAEEIACRPCPLAKMEPFRYLHFPVTGGNQVPASSDAVSASYARMADAQMARIVEAILDAPSNVLYFCSAGKDRTGVVSAILLHRLGFPRETIAADYMKSAINLHEMLTAYTAAHPELDPAVVMPQERYILEFLEIYEKGETL